MHATVFSSKDFHIASLEKNSSVWRISESFYFWKPLSENLKNLHWKFLPLMSENTYYTRSSLSGVEEFSLNMFYATTVESEFVN